MPRRVKSFTIAAPIGARRHRVARKMKGGFLPAALALPLLGAVGAPVAKFAGEQLVHGIEYLIKKLRHGRGDGRKRHTVRKHRTGGSILSALMRKPIVRRPIRRIPRIPIRLLAGLGDGRRKVHRKKRVGGAMPRMHILGTGLIRAGASRTTGGRKTHKRTHILRIRI